MPSKNCARHIDWQTSKHFLAFNQPCFPQRGVSWIPPTHFWTYGWASTRSRMCWDKACKQLLIGCFFCFQCLHGQSFQLWGHFIRCFGCSILRTSSRHCWGKGPQSSHMCCCSCVTNRSEGSITMSGSKPFVIGFCACLPQDAKSSSYRLFAFICDPLAVSTSCCHIYIYNPPYNIPYKMAPPGGCDL